MGASVVPYHACCSVWVCVCVLWLPSLSPALLWRELWLIYILLTSVLHCCCKAACHHKCTQVAYGKDGPVQRFDQGEIMVQNVFFEEVLPFARPDLSIHGRLYLTVLNWNGEMQWNVSWTFTSILIRSSFLPWNSGVLFTFLKYPFGYLSPLWNIPIWSVTGNYYIWWNGRWQKDLYLSWFPLFGLVILEEISHWILD